MKLFIANTTKQHHEFQYRIPENQRDVPMMQLIPVGQCVQIYKDDSSAVIDAIVEQHTRYGLIPVGEIDRTKDFIGMCYSIDSPIDVEKIMRALTHNDLVLKALGVEQRKQAAVAMSNQLEKTISEESGLENVLTEIEVQVEEVDARNGADTQVNETVAVAKEGTRARRTRG